jgi:hypothetical protein
MCPKLSQEAGDLDYYKIQQILFPIKRKKEKKKNKKRKKEIEKCKK